MHQDRPIAPSCRQRARGLQAIRPWRVGSVGRHELDRPTRPPDSRLPRRARQEVHRRRFPKNGVHAEALADG